MFETQQMYTDQGSITTSVTTPAVGARDAMSVEALANTIYYKIDNGVAGLEIRTRTNATENDTIVFDVLGVRDIRAEFDYYTRLGTITWTVGTQIADIGYTFCDTAVISNNASPVDMTAISPVGDYIASILLNTQGYSRLVFIATTLTGGKTVDIDIAKAEHRHNVPTGDVHTKLTEIDTVLDTSYTKLGEIDTVLDTFYTLQNGSTWLGTNSSAGGSEVVALSATSAGNGASQACKASLIWTHDADVHLLIGSGTADANDPLMVADVPLPMPYNNTNLLRFYNAGGSEEKVHIEWRA